MGYLNNVLQLPGLLLDLGGQEQGRSGHRVPVEPGEAVEHVEALHVDDGRVDAELCDLQPLAHVLDEVGRLLPVAELLFPGNPAPDRR